MTNLLATLCGGLFGVCVTLSLTINEATIFETQEGTMFHYTKSGCGSYSEYVALKEPIQGFTGICYAS